MQQPKIEFRQVRDFGEVINDTFVFIKLNFKPMMKSVLTISVVFVIAYILFSTYFLYTIQESLGKDFRIETGRFSAVTNTFLISAFGFLTIFVITLVTLCYISVYLEKKGETPTTEEVWSYCKYYFLRFLGVNILGFLMLCAGFVLCFLPGFYLWPIYSLIGSAVILENGGINYSFSRGFKLIKENWWSSFGTLIILSIIYYACAMAVSIPFLLFNSGTSLLLPDLNKPVYFLIFQNIISGIALYFSMIFTIGVAFLFFSLVEQKDSEGLLQRIQSVDNDTPKNTPEEEF